MSVRCFFIEPTENDKRWLRRFSFGKSGGCEGGGCEGGHHDAMVFLDIAPAVGESIGDRWPHDDPRWPKTCEKCGYQFADSDEWQLFTNRLYRRTDTGELMPLREASPGAMWDATWMPESCWRGPDGRCLMVICPNGRTWNIDSRASNCTMPEDKAHRCWVRHGEPPLITVDKNGLTCQAGAGSIQAGDYHGFLRNGEFTNA